MTPTRREARGRRACAAATAARRSSAAPRERTEPCVGQGHIASRSLAVQRAPPPLSAPGRLMLSRRRKWGGARCTMKASDRARDQPRPQRTSDRPAALGARGKPLADFRPNLHQPKSLQASTSRSRSEQDERSRKQGDGALARQRRRLDDRAPRRASAPNPVWVRVISPVDR